ncbi:hypothetical protein ACWKWA_15130 [Dermacoccus abyssi]
MVPRASLFDDFVSDDVPDVPGGTRATHRVLITVKAAPNPSEKSGETVCVAGVRVADHGPIGWIRLYPLNLRNLPSGTASFKKYDIITVDCVRANEPRTESWKPNVQSIRVNRFLPPWEARRPFVDPMIRSSMCEIFGHALDPGAPSLGLVAPMSVSDLVIERHPGWSVIEQRKIDAYANQYSLLPGDDRTPLEAPRFKGFYKWTCLQKGCRGHRQQVLDWEFVALQRKHRDDSEEALRRALRERFLDQICRPENDVAFYVGNQAKRHQTFSILGVYYPRR